MPLHSIKARFAISLVANILRGLLTLLTTVVLARMLGADDYGRIAFLLATFQAIRQLLDPGVSSAFYTFLSQQMRSARFFIYYGIFLSAKYLLLVGIVWFLMPESWINYAWRGESRDIVIFALSAVLMQFEWWPSTMQVLESQRRTAQAQTLYLLLLASQLAGVYGLSLFEVLSIKSFLLMSAILWASGTLISITGYQSHFTQENPAEQESLLNKYLAYCLPMIFLVFLNFAVEFSDRWFLQTFGGSREQSYFSVSQQISAVTLLITASLVRVLWKEIAEALHHEQPEQAWTLYSKAKKGLFFVSTLIAAGLGPWSVEIITIVFGPAYVLASPVFALLIFAATYQTLGQIEGTLLMASGKTGTGLLFNLYMAPLGIGLAFVLISGGASLGEWTLPSLGAFGLALKVLILQALTVNVLGYLLCQKMTWRFEWGFQIVTLVVLGFLGSFAKMIWVRIFDQPILSMFLAFISYIILVLVVLIIAPRLLDTGFDIRKFGATA